MADLAAGPDPNVARHLQGAAAALEEAATALDNADFTMAKTRLSEAESVHELALGSTSRGDWCS